MIGLIVFASAVTFYRGNTLLALCEGSPTEQVSCMSYLAGVSDGLNMTHSYVCSDVPITQAQLRDAVVRYLLKNPLVWNIEASSLVFLALTDAFPCLRANPPAR